MEKQVGWRSCASKLEHNLLLLQLGEVKKGYKFCFESAYNRGCQKFGNAN